MATDATFSAYVAARRPQLFRTAYLLCGDPHRAEDIVQDALARLYVAGDRVSRVDNVEGYVRRIVVNAHYSDRRRPWRRERTTEPREVPLEPGFPMEHADAIRAALRSVPLEQRRVIVLRHIWNLTIEETAAALGISTSTVKSQSSHALAARGEAWRRASTPRSGSAATDRRSRSWIRTLDPSVFLPDAVGLASPTTPTARPADAGRAVVRREPVGSDVVVELELPPHGWHPVTDGGNCHLTCGNADPIR